MNTLITNSRDSVNNSVQSINESYRDFKTNFFSQGGEKYQVIGGIVMAVIIILIIKFILYVIHRVDNYEKGSPYLIKTIKRANKQLVIKQRGGNNPDVLLRRSKNEQGGIEFSYQLWFYIDNWDHKVGQWKHIFHKGNEDSWPNRSPGVWIHKDKNALRVYMNTYNKIEEYVDIPNIPIQKWVHLTLVCKNRNMMVYINGYLRKTLQLTSIPKQNYGDLYINSFGGFDGLMSKFRYHDFSLSQVEIQRAVQEGPSKAPCPDIEVVPPYLATNWWQFPYF